MKPEDDPIKELKSGPIDGKSAARLVIGPEKDGGGKYPLETLHDAAITLAVFEEMEKVEDLGSCTKSDNPTASTDGHGCYPDWDEAILTIREAVVWMADDLEKEFSITPCVGQLSGGRTTEGKTAKDERPGVESNFLLALPALLADEQDGVESLGAPGRDADFWENLPNGDEGTREGGVRRRGPIERPRHDSRQQARGYRGGQTRIGVGDTRASRTRTVTKLYQNSICWQEKGSTSSESRIPESL